MEEQKFVILSKDVANAVLGYLGNRPYTEVAELINGVLGDIGKNQSDKIIYDKPPQVEQEQIGDSQADPIPQENPSTPEEVEG